MSEQCPCGSGETYESCCGPSLGGQTPAPTAEALMRSRYTAYVRNDADYLEKTIIARNRSMYNAQKTRAWNADVVWKGLTVLATQDGGADDDTGEVTFRAVFAKAGEQGEIHATSRFRRKAGQWFYVDDRPDDASADGKAAPKVGRNDPCPCGSGKKFKRCCGA